MVDFDEMCVLFLHKKNIAFYIRKVKEAVIKELASKCLSLENIIVHLSILFP